MSPPSPLALFLLLVKVISRRFSRSRSMGGIGSTGLASNRCLLRKESCKLFKRPDVVISGLIAL